jgi:SPP1 family predicted phage head-tail adaptor
MRVGALDQRIVLQTFTTAKNGKGEDIRTYSTLDTVWANVVYNGGSEPYEADQKVAVSEVLFTIRYRDDFSQVDRILWDSEYYDILSKDGNKRLRYLMLKTEKKDNG